MTAFFVHSVTEDLVLSVSNDMFSSLKASSGPLLKTCDRYGILSYIASHSRQSWCVCSSLGIWKNEK